ncbi:MAG: acyl-CoA thioesterase [Deltaproteobacteria bacterium]|nr:acyl-CoA thioesterase [Deltaproteobacteria bacterium]
MPVPLRSIAATMVRSLWSSPSKVSRMPHRVRLAYLDSNLHMNYASYLEVMELGRWDWGMRNRVLRQWLRDRLAPVVIHVDIRYRRELRALQRFVVDTRLVSLQRRTGIFQQHLLVGDWVHAKADIRFTLLREGKMIDATSLDRSVGAFLTEPLATSGSRVVGG